MPTITEFFGISIRMYYEDHPPPHFHAYYQGEEASVTIRTLEVRQDTLPRRALSLVLEWAVEHREELTDNWERAENHEPLETIEPLE